MVAIIAGGQQALTVSMEGVEDSRDDGVQQLKDIDLTVCNPRGNINLESL